jgi:TonB family protein
MMKNALLAVLLVAACGGNKKQADEDTTGPSVVGMGDSGDSSDHSGNMIPPEKMEEVTQDLKRKQTVIPQCLARAMEAGEVKRGKHGKVTLEIVISTAGKADKVNIVKSDFHEAPNVEDCVVKHVQEIEFPQLPKQYETSFTYPMEAN